MERTKLIKAAKLGYIFMSLLFVVTGAALIAVSDVSAAVIGRVNGAVFLVFGIFKLIGYGSRDLYRLAFQHDLALGAFMTAVGLISLIKPSETVISVCVGFGAFALTDSLFKIQTALDARAFGLEGWWRILAAAAASGALGLVMIFSPSRSVGVILTLMGAEMILEGLLNLITVLTAVRLSDAKRQDKNP